MTDVQSKAVSRRRFLRGSAVTAGAAAATVAMPNISRAETVNWRFQSGWPSGDIFHEFAGDYTRIVNELSGGRMNIDLLPAGAVVGRWRSRMLSSPGRSTATTA
jgi:TRAP-type mannitol/chloroaromatic compound transport system substrate-binding protein